MAGQVQQSPMFKKYGSKLDGAVKKHAGDDTKLGFQRVPPGIRAGIARVVECGFAQVAQGKQNAGEWYFRAAATVISPKKVMVDGVEVDTEGMQTSIMEMVCDTKSSSSPPKVTTMEEHVANILNEMRKMGADTSNATGADMEGIAAALKEEGPFIKFSTSLGKGGGINPATKKPYEPRVFENWNGLADIQDMEAGDGMVDGTAGGGDQTDGSDNSPSFDETADHSQPTADGDDWDSLVTLWDSLPDGDKKDKLTEKLTKMATDTGADEQEVGDAADWAAVKELMDAAEAATAAATEEPAAEEPFEADKATVYKMEVPKNPKNPKLGKKKIDVETITVDKKAKTCTLKDGDTKKPILDEKTKKPKVFSWDVLIVE